MPSTPVMESPQADRNFKIQIQIPSKTQDSPIEQLILEDEDSDDQYYQLEYDEDATVSKNDALTMYATITDGIDLGDEEFQLNSKEDEDSFWENYKKYLKAPAATTTLLHSLATRIRKRQNVFERRKPWIRWLLTRVDGSLLKSQDKSRKTPLLVATEFRDFSMVKFLCESTKDEKTIRDALRTEAKTGGNCLHVAIEEDVEKDLLDYLLKRIGDDEVIFTQRDENGNTPLHLAVHYNKCGRPQQSKLIEKLIERSKDALGVANNEGRQPLRHHIISRQEADSRAERSRLQAKTSTDNSYKRKEPPSRADKFGKELGLKRVLTGSESRKREDPDQDERKKDNKRKALSIKDGNRQDDKEKKLREKLEKEREAARKRAEKDEQAAKEREATMKEAHVIEALLKLESMRDRPRAETKNLLYGEGEKREIEFSLGRIGKKKRIDEKAIKDLEIHLQFENILQHVAIYGLEIDFAQKQQNVPSGEGRTEFCAIFDWLRNARGVEKILKVVVEDDHPLSRDSQLAHSDAAIEQALKDFDVEIWDWQKIDISVETIAKVAPNVREVHLYHSGNNAVLQGWSSTKGLILLKPSLRKVHLHPHQGLEPLDRTEVRIGQFKKDLKMAGIDVELHTIIEKSSDKEESKLKKASKKEEQRWLTCIDTFREYIKGETIDFQEDQKEKKASSRSLEPIKVALIDDGVDATHGKLGQNIKTGESFCESTEESLLCSNYYQSSQNHGTLMASQICRVCPNVKLYVLKLNEYVTDAGRQSFTIKSAAEAIEWAIKSGVDIISMSWSIEAMKEDNNDSKQLKAAVVRAIDQKIILLCSAEDKGDNSTTGSTYPKSINRDKVISIGAATASGGQWDWTGHGDVDFLLPGHELHIQGFEDQELKHGKGHSGSSLATALAAGLAALILHCAELCDHDQFLDLKDVEKIKKAFRRFNENAGDSQFIKVWTIFEEKLKDKRPGGDGRKIVKSVIKALV